MKIAASLLVFAALFWGLAPEGFSQQVPDTTFRFISKQSAYPNGKGPLVLIDAAHFNFHTKEGGFSAFGKLLEQDGYVVAGNGKPIIAAGSLKNCKVLVIANALHESNIRNWNLPTPSAFTNEEIRAIEKWVKSGGSLLLIADHMPFAGAAQELASAFGFSFLNGFAKTDADFGRSVFSFENKGLVASAVLTGRAEHEKISQVTTFTGSAFTIPAGAKPVLQFSDKHVSLQPDTAWQFHSKTPVQHLAGYYQGAIMNYGKGKIAVFGEAAMVTAQTVNGTIKVGINSKHAPQNAQFVLNLMHWLDGVKAYSGPANAEQ